VVAWENSSVEARDNSSVVAWDNSCIRNFSDTASILLWGFCVCYIINILKFKVVRKSKTSTIIKPITKKGLASWITKYGLNSKKIILYKRVSNEFKTQEKTENETMWNIGTSIEHKNWNPKNQECGEGKFHACPHPYFCDEFRKIKNDKYIAIEIKKEDLYLWPDNPEYPNKIAFRKGKVLYECNNLGRRYK
jgi:hypothetical protein